MVSAQLSHSTPNLKVGAVVVAAGQSSRMGGVDKIFSLIGNTPLIVRTLSQLQDIPEIDVISLVTSSANIDECNRLVEAHELKKVFEVIVGGARRQDSVKSGLDALVDCDVIMIHDGARPFVDRDMVLRGLEAVKNTGATAAAMPVKDTIKVADHNLIVTATPARQNLWAVQTPQLFEDDLIRRAHSEVTDDVTDDASMIESIGGKVALFEGSYNNIKVTTPEDLLLAEAILASIASSSKA